MCECLLARERVPKHQPIKIIKCLQRAYIKLVTIFGHQQTAHLVAFNDAEHTSNCIELTIEWKEYEHRI